MQIREFGSSSEAIRVVIILLGNGWSFHGTTMVREFSSISALEDRLVGETAPVVLYYPTLSPDILQVLYHLNRSRLQGLRLFMQVSAGDRSVFVNVESGEVARTYSELSESRATELSATI